MHIPRIKYVPYQITNNRILVLILSLENMEC
jgi:hypothetical protein